MVLKYYYDLLSQPSRALYILLKINKIPFEACPVALRNGEHLTDEFKEKYNRFQKVPFIHDNNFILSESVAIVRYISRQYGLGEEWYPKESKQQALIDEYLEWQHNNTRLYLAMYTQHAFIIPMLKGQEPDLKKVDKWKKSVYMTMDKIEELWLKNHKYICGNTLTVADLFAACEIEQPRLAGFDPTEGRPKLESWLNSVRNELEPVYSEAHTFVNKIAASQEKAKL
ncbi:hypothetical protein HHI36_014695 [Cryptolaemus montrouzieri]|uniref:Uncharacterized protein n=1 Tax=Cryptolaemus montrouzieri TaxID=559131 RepID=A0ABD2N3H0_9CUCU